MKIFLQLFLFFSQLAFTSFLMIIMGNLCKLIIFRNAEKSNIYVGYLLSIVFQFLILCNFNLFFPGKYVFTVFYIISAILIFIYFWKYGLSERVCITFDFLSICCVQVIAFLILFYIYRMDCFGFLEAANHDSIIYFEGMLWSMEYPLYVDHSIVNHTWNFNGKLNGGGLYIGTDRGLYRQGTYTILSWFQFLCGFSPYLLWVTCSFMPAIIWICLKILFQINHKYIQISEISHNMLVLLITFSTGWISSIVNSNIGTTFGISCILIAFFLFMSKRFQYKSLLSGITLGLSAHFYGESTIFCGFFILFSIIKDSYLISHIVREKIKTFFHNSVIVFMSFLFSGNVTIYEIVKSFIFIKSIVNQGGGWASWYIHHNPLTFFGGLLAGNNIQLDSVYNYTNSSISLFLIYFSILIIRKIKMYHSEIMILFILSIAAITVIYSTHYEYGEHKIIQLLGPCFHFMIGILFMINYQSKAVEKNVI